MSSFKGQSSKFNWRTALTEQASPKKMQSFFILAMGLFFLFSQSNNALALVTLGDLNVSNLPPADDPGWANVGGTVRTGVYMGDGWYLTAAHTGLSTAVTIDGNTYSVIPNTSHFVGNPSGFSGVAAGSDSDLRLYRIDGKPALPDIVIADSTPSINSQVLFIGDGRSRSTETTWWVDNSNSSSWSWSETQDTAHNQKYEGFKTTGTSIKRWGTNNISNNSLVSQSHANERVYIKIGGVSQRHTIGLVAEFNKNVANEAILISGDSGGAAFYKEGGDWKLTGILHSVFSYPQQNITHSIYSQASFFTDLSVYKENIENLQATFKNYSILGDINLSGDITGDGAGAWESDDITAFVEGWGFDNGLGIGDVDSWKKGDLDLDGDVDLADYGLLRSVHPDADMVAVALGFGGAVPEPSAIALVLLLAFGGFSMHLKSARSQKKCS